MPSNTAANTAARRQLQTESVAGETPAFLGVTDSARGFVWRDRLALSAYPLATAISQRHGLPELLGRVLAARGAALDAIPEWLEPTLKTTMPDPSSLHDMDRVAARLADAVQNKDPVAIFGDYDVDGAASAALMARFFAHHGVPARIYIPDRLFEGYGPNVAAIELLAKEGARLIVTVDCGTTSFEPLAAAASHGCDVMVIDHHQADTQLPKILGVVNPNRQDDISGQGHLCAAGVVFLVLVATARELRRRAHGTEAPLKDWLDLVALATVCDVVPLGGLNRAYVTQGLKVMRQRRNTGLAALADVAALDQPPNAYHLGFILGPRINAGGRIGDAGLGARLLTLDDPAEAARIAALLDKLNKERKAVEQEMLQAALAEGEQRFAEAPDLPLLIVGSEAWHKGVVGLVASRLVERFGRPACVIAWDPEREGVQHGTGSLRSVMGVDIGGAVRAAMAEGHLVKGGGHAMAAGLTVARDKLAALETFLNATLAAPAGTVEERRSLDIDGALTAAGVSDALIDLLERAGPYGQGNPQPRFALPAHRVKFAKVVGGAHVRCALEASDGTRLDAIAFRAADQPLGALLMDRGGLPLHVAGHLRRDGWGGRDRIEFMIEDAALPRKPK